MQCVLFCLLVPAVCRCKVSFFLILPSVLPAFCLHALSCSFTHPFIHAYIRSSVAFSRDLTYSMTSTDSFMFWYKLCWHQSKVLYYIDYICFCSWNILSFRPKFASAGVWRNRQAAKAPIGQQLVPTTSRLRLLQGIPWVVRTPHKIHPLKKNYKKVSRKACTLRSLT